MYTFEHNLPEYTFVLNREGNVLLGTRRSLGISSVLPYHAIAAKIWPEAGFSLFMEKGSDESE